MTQSIDLAGNWVAACDPTDCGIREQWWRRWADGGLAARLPGTSETNGIGAEVDQGTRHHLTRRRPQSGPMWWWRWVNIPAEWAGQIVELQFERCLWTSQVWLGEDLLGQRDSLTTPHSYRCPGRPGRQLLAVRTDNSDSPAHMGVGWDPDKLIAHSYSDHTQTRWNGLIGALTLSARPAVAIRSHRWQLEADLRQIDLHLELHNDQLLRESVSITVSLGSLMQEATLDLNGSPAQSTTITLQRPDSLALWDDLKPTLHQAQIMVHSSLGVSSCEERIGLRHLAASAGQLWLNNRPLHLRGTLECAIWPQTGHPPTDVGSWARVMAAIQEHGLNHLRFHSWCPPAAAFLAADEAGVLIQAEAPLWTGIGTWDDTRRFLWDETARILQAYGNHPSLMSLSHGNEPGGHDHALILHDWLAEARRLDPTRLYTCAAGWPALANNDYHCIMTTQGGGTYAGDDIPFRAHAWNQGMAGALVQHDGTRLQFNQAIRQRSIMDGGQQIPVVSHEIGQWCAYPDLSLVERLHGVTRADNYAAIRQDAAAAGLAHLTARFTYASGRLQVACYKAEIEANLATPGMSGFQLLGLQDFPGQGTAPVGILGIEWENKGYHQPAELAACCGPLVPLARFEHHCHGVGDQVAVDLLVTNYSGDNLHSATLAWALTDDNGSTIIDGQLPPQDFAQGSGLAAGSITVDLKNCRAGSALTLTVCIHEDGQSRATNQWSWWAMGDLTGAATQEDLIVVDHLDAALREQIAAGATVLHCPPPDSLSGPETAWAPIFWNSLWTNGQAPYHLGLLIAADHPALADFPTADWCDWQWHELLKGRRAIDLHGAPVSEPIVRVIDDWNHHRHLAFLTHETIGKGHLLTCCADLITNLALRPAARQLRHSLARWAGNLYTTTQP